MTDTPYECREAFEQYARHMDYDLTKHTIEPFYSNESTDVAWDAWQAAWECSKRKTEWVGQTNSYTFIDKESKP